MNYWTNENGQRLRWREWRATTPRAIVFFSHSYGLHAGLIDRIFSTYFYFKACIFYICWYLVKTNWFINLKEYSKPYQLIKLEIWWMRHTIPCLHTIMSIMASRNRPLRVVLIGKLSIIVNKNWFEDVNGIASTHLWEILLNVFVGWKEKFQMFLCFCGVTE